jgi:hypothetical protein
MSAARLLFVLLSLLVTPLYAEEFEIPHADDFCPLSPSHHILSCQGTFHAHSEADLDEYLQTVGLRNGHARNLRLHFDVNRPSLFLATPCRVVLEPERKITTTEGELCINANRGFRGLGNNELSVGGVGGLINSKDDAVIFRSHSKLEA